MKGLFWSVADVSQLQNYEQLISFVKGADSLLLSARKPLLSSRSQGARLRLYERGFNSSSCSAIEITAILSWNLSNCLR